MNSICSPLANIEQIFTLLYLAIKTEYEKNLDKQLITEIFNSVHNTNLTSEDARVAIDKYLHFSNLSLFQFKSLISKIDGRLNQEFVKSIYPPSNKCLNCYSDLMVADSRLINTYTMSGPKIYRYISMKCDDCQTIYYSDYFTRNSKGFYYNQEANYITLSNHTVFERVLIENIDAQISRNGVSFNGIFDYYKFINA